MFTILVRKLFLKNARHDIFIVWALIVLIAGTGIAVPTEAQAGSRNFLESVGISTLAGSILGASTLPFYAQPSQHTVNIGLGAAAGFTVGLGIWLVAILGGSEDESAALEPWNPPGAKEGLALTMRTGNGPYFVPKPAEIQVTLLSVNW